MSNSKRRNSAAARRRKREAQQELEARAKASFVQEKKYCGLLVSKELENALQECNRRVQEIARDCRQKNRKFRDLEFDLEHDKFRCLHGLSREPRFSPSDVQRVSQIFEKPSFFVDGANANDIVQGFLGDCWFLSALATMSTAEGLVEKFCVARDEEVGVYGFIFFRDTSWVDVIIDDLLFTSIPKFEELSVKERHLYHNDKDLYNRSARKTGKSLYFARSGTHGETWVPLIEKAYAKLHGSYAAIAGGQSGEAIEDLTGGVNTFVLTKDILDVDRFWNEELSRTDTQRLFGCVFNELDSSNSDGVYYVDVKGLVPSHTYSVLRAVEYNGKRFVVIRNPWGRTEWNGRWSDGSKEWTQEWLPALEKLGHTFGDDGEFVMEYSDFLENWDQIDRTQLFDSTWVMSCQWLEVTARSARDAWSFGDVSFTISLPAASPAVIVLSRLDSRYFQDVDGPMTSVTWMFDFVVYRKGETIPITTSSGTLFGSRSINAEVNLEAGEYVVHVRLDKEVIEQPKAPDEPIINTTPISHRNISRAKTELARSQFIVSNIDKSSVARHLPIPLSVLAGQDLSELQEKAKATADEIKKKTEEIKDTLTSEPEDVGKQSSDAENRGGKDEKKGDDIEKKVEDAGKKAEEAEKQSEDTKNKGENIEKQEKTTVVVKDEDNPETKGKSVRFDEKEGEGKKADGAGKSSSGAEGKAKKGKRGGNGNGDDSEGDSDEDEDRDEKSSDKVEQDSKSADSTGVDPHDGKKEENREDDLVIYLGLRVYTKTTSPAQIGGQLRHEMAVSFDKLFIDV